jgi:hypothetical protein
VEVIEGRSARGDVVIEGIALERQQHEVKPTWVLGGHDAEDDGHQGTDVLCADSLNMVVADKRSLECANYRGRLPWFHRWRWHCRGSKTRWRCSNSEDVYDLELDGSRSSSCLLSLGLSGGNAHLQGCESSGEVGGVVVAPKGVAACSCCDTASKAAAHSREATVTTWTVAMAVAKSNGVMLEAADATTMVSGSVGNRIAMVEVGSRWSRPKSLDLGRSPSAEGWDDLG